MSKANVDPAEIAKFTTLAARWWDKNSEFKPLHDINPLRSNWIDLHSPVAEQSVLDVGCGGGILTESLARRGAQVTGIDMGDAPLAVARLHALESGVKVEYEKSTAEDYAARHPAAFDILTCLEMLEHVPDPGSVIKACAALVKPGGHLYFSTLNRNFKAFAFAIVGAEYLLRLLPKGTHDYRKFIKPSELAGWLREAGLTLNAVTGLTYNPFTRHYKLDLRDLSVNYMVYASKPL